MSQQNGSQQSNQTLGASDFPFSPENRLMKRNFGLKRNSPLGHLYKSTLYKPRDSGTEGKVIKTVKIQHTL